MWSAHERSEFKTKPKLVALETYFSGSEPIRIGGSEAASMSCLAIGRTVDLRGFKCSEFRSAQSDIFCKSSFNLAQRSSDKPIMLDK